MSLSPPIIYGYGYYPYYGSVFGILDPCRLLWLLLVFVDGEFDDVVEGFVLLVGGFLLFVVLGLDWHWNLMTEFLRVFASGASATTTVFSAFWMTTLEFLKWVGSPIGHVF